MMSCTIGEIIITDTECVSKSYPNFWKDLKNAGFMIESVELRK
jgi:5-enolpyruvylshikimate-3-phosphate synthase